MPYDSFSFIQSWPRVKDNARKCQKTTQGCRQREETQERRHSRSEIFHYFEAPADLGYHVCSAGRLCRPEPRDILGHSAPRKRGDQPTAPPHHPLVMATNGVARRPPPKSLLLPDDRIFAHPLFLTSSSLRHARVVPREPGDGNLGG